MDDEITPTNLPPSNLSPLTTDAEAVSELPVRFAAAGIAAFYLYLADEASPGTSRRLHALRHALSLNPPPGVRDIVVGYTSLLIEHDPHVAQAALLGWVQSRLDTDPDAPPTRHHDIVVRYGEAADRGWLEPTLGLDWPDIVARHQQPTYTVAFIGFTPGFPYLLGLPDALRTARRDTPRQDIPAGAVAIAGSQTGIYPAPSPGGWWVLGRTDAALYHPDRDPPTLLQPGDTVRFVDAATIQTSDGSIRDSNSKNDNDNDKNSGDNDDGDSNDDSDEAVEVVDTWPNSASLQSGPRWGFAHYGLAQSGVLDPVAFEVGNALVGNAPDAVALEVMVHPQEFVARRDCRVCLTGGGFRAWLGGKAVAGWRAFDWRQGERLELSPDRDTGLTGYLCVAGGFAARHDHGSASTDARGRLGGKDGRYLQRGDRLSRATTTATNREQPYPGTVRYPERIEVRIYPGPQYDEAAFGRLLGSSYHLSGLNRMGARLSGPPLTLPDYDVLSEGSPWGAVQIPADGQPIVLLSDRGRTGGYPKPAVCDVHDLWQLAQAKVGTEVWFVLGTAQR
ncbi:MAG: urea amidolyase family protein [Trueperaceae bacterium]|nr:urea amidolyase family protein [Trueperaceae bacterium]